MGSIYVVQGTIDASYVPADRLAYSCEEVLGLFGNRREVFEDDVAVVGTDPEGTRGVIGLQM